MNMTLLLFCFLMSFFQDSKFTIEGNKMNVIFDTDANNELDDQFALAYLLMNGQVFDVEGVTVNATFNGGDIHEHYAEARRVMQLSNRYGDIPLLKGADGSFENIKGDIHHESFDGSEAVDFIIRSAHQNPNDQLVIIAVGKLTNVALAIEKDPAIISKVRVVWLGSNYPQPGEYNQDNDPESLNYLLSTQVPFEMVTVRYGKPSGTDAVRVTQEEINRRMPGLGPEVEEPVTGRHGGGFRTFGDYAVSLFEHIDYHGDPPSRALFDMAAVAILKNPGWASSKEIPAPVLVGKEWQERPGNARKIVLWEDFDRDAIIADFFTTMKIFQLVDAKASGD
jgi:purine nucleosidase